MEILAHWALGPIAAVEPLPGPDGPLTAVTGRDGRCWVLKRRTTSEDVEREAALLGHLRRKGLPVAPPEPALDGRPFALTEGGPVVLYPRLPGVIVAEPHRAEGARGRAAAFGEGIAALHEGLRDFPQPGRFPELHLIRHLRDKVRPALSAEAGPGEPDVDPAAALEIAGIVEARLSGVYPELPVQLIHRDPHPSNLLLADGKVSGYLDFDLCVLSARIFDPAYVATSLLVSPWEGPAARAGGWPPLLRGVFEGYGRRARLEPAERGAIFPVLLAIQLIFTAFFRKTRALPLARANLDAAAWLLEREDDVENWTRG